MRTRIAGGLFPAALRAPGRLTSLEKTKTAPKGGLKVHGSSEGIRTLDLRLERAAS